MTGDGPSSRMEEFRRRMASSTFTSLEEVDPALAHHAREVLANEFVVRAGISESRRQDVLAAVTIEVGDGLVRVTLGDLGTATVSWDGSLDGLDSIVAERAWAFSDTYKEDRGRYGQTPWG